jgi:hypothetical protein
MITTTLGLKWNFYSEKLLDSEVVLKDLIIQTGIDSSHQTAKFH